MSKNKAGKNKLVKTKESTKNQIRKSKTKANNYIYWLGFILVITFIIYFSSIKNDFVNFDDERYIFQNEVIKEISEKNITKWFTTYYDGHYHPLSQLSLAIDYRIARLSLPISFQVHELKANVFHFVNIILHILNVLFVFLLVKRLFGGNEIAIIVALLFGLHPINVETVAWVSERKNLLFALFFLTSLFNYAKFLQKTDHKYYYYSLLLFILAVLSKVTAVSLFFCLFLIEYFLEKKTFNKKVLLLKLPYFVIAVVFIIIASLAQSSSWDERTLPYNFIDKIFLASYGFIQYIVKIIAPLNLSAYYPYPVDIGNDINMIQYFSPALVIGVLILIFALIKKKQKELVFGLVFFILNIALLIKLFDIPYGNYLMADRYAYIPSIGIFIMIGWGFAYVCKKFKKNKTIYIIIIVIYIGILSISTKNRINIWKNSSTLWTDVIEKYPDYSLPYNMRGMDRIAKQEFKKGISDFQKSIKLNPENVASYMNLGMAYKNTGNYDGARDILTEAIAINDTLSQAYYLRGYLEFQVNSLENAIRDYTKYLELKPNNVKALLDRGFIFTKQTQYNRAFNDFNKAIELNPDNPRSYYLRAVAFQETGNKDKACKDFKKVSELGVDVRNEIELNCM